MPLEYLSVLMRSMNFSVLVERALDHLVQCEPRCLLSCHRFQSNPHHQQAASPQSHLLQEAGMQLRIYEGHLKMGEICWDKGHRAEEVCSANGWS